MRKYDPNCEACNIEKQDLQVKQMPAHNCNKSNKRGNEPETLDKLTYEQRVQQMAEHYAIEYWHPDLTEERAYFFFSTDAKIAVAAQAEAIREFYSKLVSLGINLFDIELHLIENGYVPAPEANVVSKQEIEPALIIMNLLLSNPSMNLGDQIYQGRDNEGLGWEGPNVTAWSEAVGKAKELLDKYPHINSPENEQK